MKNSLVLSLHIHIAVRVLLSFPRVLFALVICILMEMPSD